MNNTYFEGYDFDVDVVYSFSVRPVVINQCCSEYEWITVVELQ